MPYTTYPHGSVTIYYRRFTPLWKGSLCLLFCALCVILLWMIHTGYAGRLETIYYSVAAVLGLWIVGPLVFVFVTRLTERQTVLFAWNDAALHVRRRTIHWLELRRIELVPSSVGKWLLLGPACFVLELRDGTRVHVSTDHLLNKRELLQSLLLLQLTLREKQDQDH